MLTEILGLNVWVGFYVFIRCFLSKLSAGHVRSPRDLDHTHGQMGCEQIESGNNEMDEKKQKEGKQEGQSTLHHGVISFMPTGSVSYFAAFACVCLKSNF